MRPEWEPVKLFFSFCAAISLIFMIYEVLLIFNSDFTRAHNNFNQALIVFAVSRAITLIFYFYEEKEKKENVD